MSGKSEKAIAENKWKPGQSGNPAGRPKGAKNKTTLMKQAIEGELVEELQKDVKDVLAKAVSLAKDGNEQMIKLIIDKFIPNARVDDGEGSKGVGGINIVVQGYEKPTINVERVKEEDDER